MRNARRCNQGNGWQNAGIYGGERGNNQPRAARENRRVASRKRGKATGDRGKGEKQHNGLQNNVLTANAKQPVAPKPARRATTATTKKGKHHDRFQRIARANSGGNGFSVNGGASHSQKPTANRYWLRTGNRPSGQKLGEGDNGIPFIREQGMANGEEVGEDG